MSELIRVEDFGYSYPKSLHRIRLDEDFVLNAGEAVLISGSTGCGKSTLLSALAGTIHGETDGNITVSPDLIETRGSTARISIALVLQNPETQLLCSTVAEETAFGPQNLGMDSHEIRKRTTKYLTLLGLEGLENRHVEDLSMGQKQRLALASVLTMEPRVLLMDEPFSQLDPLGRKILIDLMYTLKDQGRGIVVCEHALDLPPGLIDRHIHMSDKPSVTHTAPEPACTLYPPRQADPVAPIQAPLVHIENLSLAHEGSSPILHDITLEVNAGEKVLISGENGSGKSSLLKCIIGAVHPARGRVQINGRDVEHPALLSGTVGYLMQNPERQLFSESVYEEVAFGLKRMGLAPETWQEQVWATLSLMKITDLAERSPFTLSFGQKHLVALASVLAARPRVILLDEPFTGLDVRLRDHILAVLDRVHALSTAAIIITSHDKNLTVWVHRHITMEKGQMRHALPAE